MKFGIYKIYPDAFMPSYATPDSACFDLRACLLEFAVIKVYTKSGDVLNVDIGSNLKINIEPGSRALIPTGLIFDIPKNYSVRLHPRSGLALKEGLILANCEGVIDADYIDPVFVIVYNISNKTVVLKHGDRICQGELVATNQSEFEILRKAPTQKTNRNGGFGSTGK